MGRNYAITYAPTYPKQSALPGTLVRGNSVPPLLTRLRAGTNIRLVRHAPPLPSLSLKGGDGDARASDRLRRNPFSTILGVFFSPSLMYTLSLLVVLHPQKNKGIWKCCVLFKPSHQAGKNAQQPTRQRCTLAETDWLHPKLICCTLLTNLCPPSIGDICCVCMVASGC